MPTPIKKKQASFPKNKGDNKKSFGVLKSDAAPFSKKQQLEFDSKVSKLKDEAKDLAKAFFAKKAMFPGGGPMRNSGLHDISSRWVSVNKELMKLTGKGHDYSKQINEVNNMTDAELKDYYYERFQWGIK